MDTRLTALVDRFVADPADSVAFDGLEEHHFLHAEWHELVRLYERRVEAADLAERPRERGQLRFRLGQILEERCRQTDRAVDCYREVARLDPSFRPALVRLREIYTERGQWDLVLQIAEVEAGQAMAPAERAALSAELGRVWLDRMDDPGLALEHFETALTADPHHVAALTGAASVHEQLGDPRAAAERLEQLIADGAERAGAEPMLALARLLIGPLDDRERGAQLVEAALAREPEHPLALDVSCELAVAGEQWEWAADLLERRFGAAAGTQQRVAIARMAGRIHAEELGDPERARMWLERTLALDAEDHDALLALADIERRTGNGEALADLLMRIIRSFAEPPRERLLEAAALAEAREDHACSADVLRRLLEASPDDVEAMERLAAALVATAEDDELLALNERRLALGGDGAERAAVLVQLADLHARRGDEAGAQTALAGALQADPGCEGAVDRLARDHAAAGRKEALLALVEDSARTASRRRLLRMRVMLGELLLSEFSDTEGARDAFRAALEIDASDQSALHGFEHVALRSGDDDTILEAFEREAAVTTDGDRLAFLVWELVRILEQREQHEEALLWLERLAAVAPDDRDVLGACARLHEQLDHDLELIEHLDRLDPLLEGKERAANQRRLAEVYSKRGNQPSALHAYRRALEAHPGDAVALRAMIPALERAEDHGALADIYAQLADLVQGPERIDLLNARARLFEGPLADPGCAVLALEAVAAEPGGPDDAEDRLETVLTGAARFETLLTRLERRRRGCDEESPLAAQLDAQRASLLMGPLDRPQEAAALLAALRTDSRLGDPERAHTTEQLEEALRRTDDRAALAALLAELAEEGDPDHRVRRQLERADLLAELPGQAEACQALYAEIADGGSEHARAAAEKLETLLERDNRFGELRERLEARLATGPPAAEALALRERLAVICERNLDDRTAAANHLASACELAPERAALWQGLARLQEIAGDRRALLGTLERELTGTEPDTERELDLRRRAAGLLRNEFADPGAAAPHTRRILALAPGDAAAAEFLIEQLEQSGSHEELLPLLEARLERALRDETAGAGAVTGLRLRIAGLLAGALDDVDRAIETLEAAADEPELLAVIAEPLADLYQRAERADDLQALCQRASGVCDSPEERASWTLRRAEALRASGRLEDSAEAYREALAGRPDEGQIRAALGHLYRTLGEDERLAELLRAELAEVGGGSEVPLRFELAGLLEAGAQFDEALSQLRRVLELAPHHVDALARALTLAERLERHEDRLALLDARLERSRSPEERARILGDQAELLAATLERPEEAVRRLREALQIAPADRGAHRSLRALQEAAGDWGAALETLEQEWCLAPRDEQRTCLEQGVGIAERSGEPDAALPWLMRLRALRPDDASVLERISALHRDAQRPEPLVAALREEAALASEPARRAMLLRECAEVLQQQLGAPGRAIATLEKARAAAPEDRGTQIDLAAMLRQEGRNAELACLLDSLANSDSPTDRVSRLRELAAIALDKLGDPSRAAGAAWQALASDDVPNVARHELLRFLARALAAAGRLDLWARAAAAELDSLDEGEPVFDERRCELHRDLARAHAGALARPDRALPHWQALLDWPGDETTDPTVREEAESAVLAGLRALRDDIELERRLRNRLEQGHGQAADWLELGQLSEEHLHRYARAAAAYCETLERDGECLAAVQGLRRCAERLGDMDEVARALDLELTLQPDVAPAARAALFRRLGEIAWHSLDSTTRASRAFAAALEADPRDLDSLRALQALFETMEDWRGALEMLESEIELLGDAEPERRREVWLRVGTLARDFEDDLARAVRGYEEAAEVGPLSTAEVVEWAELYDRTGDTARFAEVFGGFCDDPDAAPHAADLLRLAAALEQLERSEEALARAEQATEIDPHSGPAWDEVARLRSEAGDAGGSAAALEASAGCQLGGAAAERLLAAALQIEAADPDAAARMLGRAVEQDAGHAACHAALARVAHGLARLDVAEFAAVRCLGLVTSGSPVDAAAHLAAALCGAEASAYNKHLERAIWLYGVVLELEPAHPEALSGLGESLFDSGDMEAARATLEKRLEDESYPERPLHLLLHAKALEAVGAQSAALDRFRDAIEAAPGQSEAHAGATAILERAGRRAEAVDGLQRWAALTDASSARGELLLRAGRILLLDEADSEPAEALLREATSVHPAGAGGWAVLAELLWGQERCDEALSVATLGLAAIAEDAAERAPLSRIRAAALERSGDRSEAAQAYRGAARSDPRDSASALAGARLLRALGEWREAATLLEDFVADAPGAPADTEGMAAAWHQLGRLRAGPLEDVAGAVEAYREALSADPSLRDAEEALAQLLAHVPDGWDEAVERHRTLLDHDPTRVASLRSLLRIAHGRGDEAAQATGSAILRALGAATADERRDAPLRAVLRSSGKPALADPLHECARQISLEVAQEIGDTLEIGAPGTGPDRVGAEPVAAFRAAVIDAEAKLIAPALVPLPAEELGSTLVLVAQLSSEAEDLHGDGNLINRLAQKLGRRARRRVRRTLGERGADEIATIDFASWRVELRALASATVLEAGEGSLRDALIAWLRPREEERQAALPDEADISSLIPHCPEALALLRRTVDGWLQTL